MIICSTCWLGALACPNFSTQFWNNILLEWLKPIAVFEQAKILEKGVDTGSTVSEVLTVLINWTYCTVQLLEDKGLFLYSCKPRPIGYVKFLLMKTTKACDSLTAWRKTRARADSSFSFGTLQLTRPHWKMRVNEESSWSEFRFPKLVLIEIKHSTLESV